MWYPGSVGVIPCHHIGAGTLFATIVGHSALCMSGCIAVFVNGLWSPIGDLSEPMHCLCVQELVKVHAAPVATNSFLDCCRMHNYCCTCVMLVVRTTLAWGRHMTAPDCTGC
jgi:hypothetical protein